MKTLLSYLALFLLLLASSFATGKQNQINEQMIAAELPADPLAMQVQAQDKDRIAIRWTLRDLDIDHYVIERSDDGTHFQFVDALPHAEDGVQKYIHHNKNGALPFCRIVAYHKDGSTTASAVQAVGSGTGS